MAEIELALTKRPDISFLPNPDLHASAERDFTRAIGLAQSYSGKLRETTGTLIHILKFQGSTDFDATPLRDSIQDSLSKMNPHERAYAIYDLARVEIRLGNIPAANTALEATEEFETISNLRLEFAEEYAKAGIDPQPMLDKVKQTAGRVRIKTEPDVFEISTDKQIEDAMTLAVTHFKLGIEPTPFLTQARELLESHPPYEKDFFVGELVEAYAVCGYFTNALTLVDKITSRHGSKSTKEKRTEARHVIAQEQLKYGDVKGGIDTAEGSKDNILIGEINARAAIYKAEEGEDPTAEIERTLSLILTIENSLSQGILYSMLGRVKALVNEDPKPMFVMAMEKTLSLKVSEDPMADLFNRFIADVDASGFDATPVFRIALEWADSALKERLNPRDISIPEINQGMAIEAIIQQQIKLGYLEMAEQTLPKLEQESWVYIPLLAALAHAKAKKAVAS